MNLSGRRFRLLAALLITLLIILAWLTLRDLTDPELTVTPAQGFVSPSTGYLFTARDEASGVDSVSVKVIQDGVEHAILEKTYPDKPTSVSEEFVLPKADLSDGPMRLGIQVSDGSMAGFGSGNKAVFDEEFTYDATKPRLGLVSYRHYVNQGGTGCVVFTVDEEGARAGVRVGEVFYPAHEQESGEFVGFFAFACDTAPADFVPVITAMDRAGNTSLAHFNYTANPRQFSHDRIQISDLFLTRKMGQFRDRFPEAETLAEVFLKVNTELRTSNREALRDIGMQTSHEPLWRGAFLRMPGTQTRSGFGDLRDYYYKGEKIDRQRHMGVDLASVRHDRIPAANSGQVVFADFLGIYGNCVVIDHGLGLQSLYAHLSNISVTVNDKVERGQTIGYTGATGLAGGDHLHFTMLVSGTPVTPKEWWDATWIGNNIIPKLYPPDPDETPIGSDHLGPDTTSLLGPGGRIARDAS